MRGERGQKTQLSAPFELSRVAPALSLSLSNAPPQNARCHRPRCPPRAAPARSSRPQRCGAEGGAARRARPPPAGRRGRAGAGRCRPRAGGPGPRLPRRSGGRYRSPAGAGPGACRRPARRAERERKGVSVVRREKNGRGGGRHSRRARLSSKRLPGPARHQTHTRAGSRGLSASSAPCPGPAPQKNRKKPLNSPRPRPTAACPRSRRLGPRFRRRPGRHPLRPCA